MLERKRILERAPLDLKVTAQSRAATPKLHSLPVRLRFSMEYSVPRIPDAQAYNRNHTHEERQPVQYHGEVPRRRHHRAPNADHPPRHSATSPNQFNLVTQAKSHDHNDLERIAHNDTSHLLITEDS
jgi:hypothetical protein